MKDEKSEEGIATERKWGLAMTGEPMSFDPAALDLLQRVNQYLSTRRIRAYLVGGFVRDTLVCRSTADIDIAVDADALTLAAGMAHEIGGKFVPLDEEHKIARIVELTKGESEEPWYIDLSTMEGDIQQDLKRRDFTIDALAIDLKNMVENPEACQIIDPTGGQEDLKQRLVKAVDDQVFESDPLRLLRAVRLSAELDFSIAPETQTLMRRDCRLISRSAGERVREELLRIFATNQAAGAVRMMDNLGLLTATIPELEAMRGVEQPKEHHWDVLNHSLETVGSVDYLLRRGTWAYAGKEVLEDIPWSAELEQHFDQEISTGSSRASLTKLAGLFHDVAKPETKIISNGRVRFFGHTKQGAAATSKILERLRFTNKEIGLVELMVRYHLRPTQMSHEGMPTRRAIYRYFRDTGAAGIDIIFLSLADHLAARGPDLDMEQWKWHVGQANHILAECFQHKEIIAPAKLIDGHDLLNLFGLKPGPQIRSILEAVKEAQAEGEIHGRDEALSYVKNRLL